MPATYQFWADSSTPTATSTGPGSWVLGSRWQPAYNGTVTAVRFYKIAADTGTHIGTLYRESDSALLGSVTFSGETASGWQTATFGSPVAVSAGQVYRIAVSHAGVNWGQQTSYAYPLAVPGLMSFLGGCYNNGTSGYPGGASADYHNVDLVFSVNAYSFYGYADPSPYSTDTYNFSQMHGMDFSCSSAGATVDAILFWKAPADTGLHTGAIYRVSDQALLGSVVFSGETASGWQTGVFTTPIPIVAGVTYRTSLCRNVAIAYKPGYTPPPSGPLTAGPPYYVNSTTVPSFPNNSAGGSNGLTDVRVSLPSAVLTDVRVSQALAETWVANPPPVLASQIAAEAWSTNAPQVVSSQALAEVWIPSGIFVCGSQAAGEVFSTNVAAVDAGQIVAEMFINALGRVQVSQVFAEVWQSSEAASIVPPPRRYRISEQVP